MVLEISNLKKHFTAPDGSVQCVIDVSEFALREGEQVAVKGESGTGKTTFLNLIAGILSADAGDVRIDGEPMTGRSESERDSIRANKIGYIFQTFNLFQGFTAIENVLLGMAFGVGVDRAHASRLLEKVGLADRSDYLPRQLSVGQQQRVAVARALANRPRLVLADEPTGNLDRKRAAEALKLIREICADNGSALLLVSHDHEILSSFETMVDLGDLNKCS